MKDFDVKQWRNYENVVQRHGETYEEYKRGDIFVVFCPECQSPDVFVTNECDIGDEELDEASFFWADYECKMCGCKFRSRFSRNKRFKKWLLISMIFVALTLFNVSAGGVALVGDDFAGKRAFWVIIFFDLYSC